MHSPKHHSLSASLDALLTSADGKSLTFDHVLSGVGEKAFGLLLVILSLPSALPVPAPGYSTPFGILLAILSVQMILMRKNPVLPAFARKRDLSFSTAKKLFSAANAFLRRIEVFIHPRMKWIGKPASLSAVGWLTLVMSCLMILPIPLTNTFPAMIIFLVGVGLTEEDGVIVLIGAAIGVLAVAFYAYLIYLVATYGVDGVLQLKDIIKGWLGMQS